MSGKKLHYKPNVTYELLIHGVYHYIGCHTVKSSFLWESQILHGSGNYLKFAYVDKLITSQEYRSSVVFLWIKEFDTKEEALQNEILEIQKCKESYGDLCLNRALFGNRGGSRGVTVTTKTREKLREKSTGRVWSEETKRKWKEANKGKHHYTNGIINVRSVECPEGFHLGRTLKWKKVTN